MKRLFQVTAAMGSFSLANLIVGFVRAKYSAVILGPDGVGVLSQASGFLIVVITVCALNSGTGIMKRFAEARDAGDIQRVRAILDTTFQLLCLTSVGVAAVLAFAQSPVARILLGDTRLAPALLGIVIALPFDVLTATLWQSVLLGADRYDVYTRASLATTVVGLAPFLLMTYFWGVLGAILSIGVAAVLRHWVFSHYTMLVVDWRPRIVWSLSGTVIRSLLGYGAAMLWVAVLLDGTNLTIRTLILGHLGAVANGIYQVPVAFSAYYSVFFTNGLWGHFYPTLSRPIARAERLSELNSAFRFITLGVTIMAAVLLVVRKPLITALYSSRFGSASDLIPFYLVGDLFLLLAMAYTVSLLALPRLKAYVAIWTVFCVGRTALAWPLLTFWGLAGAAAAYAISAVGLLLVCVIYHARVLLLPATGRNIGLLASGAAVLITPLLLPLHTGGRIAAQLLLVAVWLLVVVSSEEWATVGRFLARPVTELLVAAGRRTGPSAKLD